MTSEWIEVVNDEDIMYEVLKISIEKDDSSCLMQGWGYMTCFSTSDKSYIVFLR